MENPSVYLGTIEEIRVPEIINSLSRGKETGALHLKRQHLEKTLYFEEGKIVFAASNDPDERLGVLLLRRNKITYRQLQECAPKVNPTKRLGTILVLEGIIQPNDLYHGVVDQIKEMIYGVFDWDNGKFGFQPGPLPQKEVITLNLSAPDLIMTGMQRIWRWSWIRQALPALDTVYRKREGWTPIVRKMTLTREMEGILDLFDRPRTLGEVLQISSVSNFETCRLIWTFMILGIIEEILLAPTWSEEPAAPVTEVFPLNETPVIPEETTLKMEMEPQLAAGAQATYAEEQAPKSAADGGEKELASLPADDLEPLLAEPVPFSELSLSDLVELTDAVKTEKTLVSEERPSLQPWEMRIQPDLKEFNDLHRYIYEMVNLELGNVTNTFLSKAFKKASVKYPLVFEGVSMNEFGEFADSVLLANIQGNLVQDYQKALDFLIAEERSMISLFLEIKRVNAIENGVKRILERRNQALT